MSKAGREWVCQQIQLVPPSPPIAISSGLTWSESVKQCCPRGVGGGRFCVFKGAAGSTWNVTGLGRED